MLIEIRFVSYDHPTVVHIGEATSKEACQRLIDENKPAGLGVYEYVVHEHTVRVFASMTDSLAVEKTLDRIFKD